MKTTKLLLTALIATVLHFNTVAQQWTTTGNNIYNSNYQFSGINAYGQTEVLQGKVAIGFPSPVVDASPYNYTSVLQIQQAKSGNQQSGPGFPIPAVTISATNNSAAGTMDLGVRNGGFISVSNGQAPLSVLTTGLTLSSVPNSPKMANLTIPNGIVTIGAVTAPFITDTHYPNGGYYNYGLYVGNGILTEKVKVAVSTTSNWSDYVFSKDYRLLSLGQVEAYVKKNKHLPGVPSAEEVVKEGIDMATMDAKLLEKIEELTLYMIEMKKESDMLKKEIEVLKKK
jgi:hypothetical protein